MEGRFCQPLIDALKMPGTVLHYRVVADNGAPGGPVHGADATFVVPGRRASALSRIVLLAVRGSAAKVSRILANGGAVATFKAPGAGTAQITWSVRSKGKTVTAATGRHTAVGKSELETASIPPSTFTIKLKLTRQGRALLTKLKRGHTPQADRHGHVVTDTDGPVPLSKTKTFQSQALA